MGPNAMWHDSTRVDLQSLERVLSGLPREERDELLESLVIAVCSNADEAQSILFEYLREHDFQSLVCELQEYGVPREEAP